MEESNQVSRRNLLRKASSSLVGGAVLGAGAIAGTEPTAAGRGKELAFCETMDDTHKICVYRPTRRVRRRKAPTNQRIFVGNAKVYLNGGSPEDFNLHIGSWTERRAGKRYYHAWVWESKIVDEHIHIRARSPRQLAQRVGSVVSKQLSKSWRYAKGPLKRAIIKLFVIGVGAIVSIVLSPFTS